MENVANISVSKISLCILIHGPHQSDPEKLSRIYLFYFLAIFFASSKLVYHLIVENDVQKNPINKKVDKSFIFMDTFFI